MNKANINYVKNVLNGNKAKKKYGQNFLIDANVVEKIAKIASDTNLLTIEIGPGLGALSEFLLQYSKQLDAYEIDKDAYEILKRDLTDPRFNIYLEDFLDTDLTKYEGIKLNVASNLPYYVTTPILFKLFKSKLDINKITVMVQKEVCDRFIAKVNSPDYNSLSIIVQYLFEVKQELIVKRSCFYPSPNVDSAVVSFTPKRERNFEYEEKLFSFIEKCFVQRRKTLHNNLKEFLNDEEIEKIYTTMNFKENIRAQEIELCDFIKMCEIINK